MKQALGWLGVVGVAVGLAASGCSATDEGDDDAAIEDSESELRESSNRHYFYTGPLDALRNPEVILSIKGHTARVHGSLPDGITPARLAALSELPHARVVGKEIDLVYPIASSAPGISDSAAGRYRVYQAQPYRPNDVHPWGGFPFIAYNPVGAGIAMHGPIDDADNRGTPNFDVWYLNRGNVSHGCNRMLGEHVTEIAHLIGINMRKVHSAGQTVANNATVRVTHDYDTLENGKKVDTDYPTNDSFSRPTGNVKMFRAWIASEMPDGRDLPKNADGINPGVADFSFVKHVETGWVCSMSPGILPKLRAFAQSQPGDQLPKSFCQGGKRFCVANQLNKGKSPQQIVAACGL